MESVVELAVIVKCVSKSFVDAEHRLTAVTRDISFTMKKGEIVGLFGPSGCGKTTLLRLISGIIPPDEGTIHIYGERIDRRRGLVAYVPQRGTLLPWMTLWDNALLGWSIVGSSKEDSEVIQRTTALFAHFGLAGITHRYPEHCSGGERQRVALIRALLTPAQLLALDEPLGAIDHITRGRIYETLLEEVQIRSASMGKPAVIIISHDPEELLFFCDRILIMSERPARLVAEVRVPFVRPREKEIKFTPEFVEAKKYLWSLVQ